MSCSWCKDSGFVFAYQITMNGYPECAFICGACSQGDYRRGKYKTYPVWEERLHRLQFVPHYESEKPLDKQWVVSMTEEGRTEEPEFQRRMKIWGREHFVSIWKIHQDTKKA